MDTDFLVIGSGVAGLSFSLQASKLGKVLLVTKNSIEESNTFYAQGGMAGVFGSDDSFQSHVEDTLRTGDGLANRKIAEILAQETPQRILELDALGVPFDKEQGHFKLSREAVHSRARIVHSSDISGKAVEQALARHAWMNKNIHLLEHHFASELIVKNGSCYGCIALHEKNFFPLFARHIILATGGMGQLYEKTTNPPIATGDGIALAFRAGALLEDMEFVQFHPTMLHNSKPAFLISETLRGEGGILKNKFGKAYMKNYHRDGDLAPRDVVSKFSLDEMKRTGAGHVYLDMSHFDGDYLKKRFPHIYAECMKYNVDLTKDMIPVSPAAHYLYGGIMTDENGCTNIRNLYAIGECACTELHGADRLASNSLTEGLVFGKRLADFLKDKKGEIHTMPAALPAYMPSNSRIQAMREELRKIMWRDVGILRTGEGLSYALHIIQRREKELASFDAQDQESGELSNLLLAGKIIAFCALRRKESRGTHFFAEHPQRDDARWQRHLTIDKSHFR